LILTARPLAAALGEVDDRTIGELRPIARTRRTPLRRDRGIAAILIALMLTGCSSSDDAAENTTRVVQIGAPGETNRVLGPDEVAALETPGYTDGDVEFVQGMIHHHQQALEMIALVDERAGRSDLPLLATRMEVSQRDEITQLETWLVERDEEVPDDHNHDDAAELMPGMLTAEQLAQLEAASGTHFDALFLQYMIGHHEGAVMMVEELLTAGFGGQEPQVFQLAQNVEIDQQVEIARMKSVLAELAADE
jgi:uncharacterized protein (DUF305 family)